MSESFPVRLPVTTRAAAEMIDITAAVAQNVPPGFDGACLVFCRHTTAAVTINENADPDVVSDLLHELERLVPRRNPAFRHAEGNSAAHVKATLVGADVIVPVRDGRLQLGTWQAVFFCEFDGPRTRHVLIQLMPAP